LLDFLIGFGLIMSLFMPVAQMRAWAAHFFQVRDCVGQAPDDQQAGDLPMMEVSLARKSKP